jgi:hypothetical protein
VNRIVTVLPLLLIGYTSGVSAQETPAQKAASWELNGHGAALRTGLFEESGQALQAGGRLARNFANGLSIGGNVDWASTNDVTLTPFAGLTATLLLTSAEIGYQFDAAPRVRLFLSGGAGIARLAIQDPPPSVTESSTGLLIPVGGGIKIHNRPVAPTWALRFDLRDNVILLEEAHSIDGNAQAEPRHNVEVSAGFSFLLGGRRQAAVVQLDTDRDGIDDASDWCLNRPGLAVDARGCPLDQDADGVPNEWDECPGTQVGIRADDRGCPLEMEAGAEPEPAAAQPVPERAEEPGAVVDTEPAPGRGRLAAEPPARETERTPEPTGPADGDRDGVPDTRDLCQGTPAGIRVDDRGCLPRPEVAAPGQEPLGEPAVAPPRVIPPSEPAAGREEAKPLAQVGCLDNRRWFTAKQPIRFEGRPFELVGSPAAVDAQYLVRAGTFDSVPLFASVTERAPYTSLWLPRCGNEGLYELYIQSGTVP